MAGELGELRAEIAANKRVIETLAGSLEAMAERLLRYQACWEQVFDAGDRHGYERAAQAATQFPARCLRVVAGGN